MLVFNVGPHIPCFSVQQSKNNEYLYFIFIFYIESSRDVKIRNIKRGNLIPTEKYFLSHLHS